MLFISGEKELTPSNWQNIKRNGMDKKSQGTECKASKGTEWINFKRNKP